MNRSTEGVRRSKLLRDARSRSLQLVVLALLLSAATSCRRGTDGTDRSVAPPASSAVSPKIGSATARAPASPPPKTKAPPPCAGGGARSVASRLGMVVSVEPQATAAGTAVLSRGGNAVDAAVAVGYALAVTHPSAGNLGGGGFMLVRSPDGKTEAIDFRERAPAAVTEERFDAMIAADAVGPAASGVPGTVAGLNLALERFGTMKRGDVLAPAIALARKGFSLGERQAKTVQWAWPWLKNDPSARSVFGKGGKPRAPGEQIVRKALAGTLERIAKDGDVGFYYGPTADRIVAGMKPRGLITHDDLESYRAVVRIPLRVPYRGRTVFIAPPPSAGGVAVGQMLGMLERLRANELPRLGGARLHLLAETARRAHATRRFSVVDPDSVPGYDLTAEAAAWFDWEALLARPPVIDRQHATPSAKVSPLYDAAMRELEHTTHFSVVDKAGWAVSCTTTLSAGFGARYIPAGTGVVMNNSLAAFGTVGRDRVKPGRRMTSSMSPVLVVRDSELELVLGSPGGDTIPNTVVQVLTSLIDYGLLLEDAVDAPRIHHGFVPDEIRYEAARKPSPEALAYLEKLGHQFSRKRTSIGDANVIAVREGVAFGYPDPREGGLAQGPASVSDPPSSPK